MSSVAPIRAQLGAPPLSVSILILVMSLVARAAVAQPFSFASFSFDQSNTPDSGFGLNGGVYSGAIVTSFPSTATSSIVGFPSSTSGFDSAKSVGRLLGLSASNTRAVNLPSGNNGATARSGFLLTWSGARKLQNTAGDDLVIYESGSTSTSPEAFMLQVYNVATASWTSWYYEPADTFQLYTGDPSEGGFATGIDLSDLGIPLGVAIDRIHIVNLTDEDRMLNSNGRGQVLPEDNGATSNYFPDPGPLASYTMYSATTLDPDPLYVAALHAPSSAACGNGAVEPSGGEQCDPGPDVASDCCDASCQIIADSTPCDDGLFCTVGGSCSAGACVTTPRDCSDPNPCTQDSCNEGTDQCVNDPTPLNGTSCDDGLFCTVSDLCQSGSCGGTANSCNDSNACTADSCDESGDACVHDAAALDGSACDDSDACTPTSTCSAASCVGGPPTLVCGDSLTCGSEQCDDGNSTENDGCSSACDVEIPQSQQQRTCLKLMNAAGTLVAAAEGKVSLTCLLNAQRGDVPDAQACLVNDPSGRVGKARHKTERTFARGCPVLPDFGGRDATTVNDAAVEETIGAVGDVFGADLGSVAASSTADFKAAKCQSTIVKGNGKLAAAQRREFLICLGLGLDGGHILSPAGIDACLDAITLDGRGKVLAAKNRLAAGIEDRCADVDLSVAVPGDCAAAADVAGCINEQIRCRSCRTFVRINGLTRDCDAFDDGTVNSSCPD